MTTAPSHQPVLMQAVLAALAIRSEGCYVDGTYGRGGHSAGILEQLGPRGRLLAMDKDPEAVEHARARFGADVRFTIVHAGFETFSASVAPWLAGEPLCGVVLDLGVSSPQLDSPQRGFSFARDGPLDMRMNHTAGRTAAEWLAEVTEPELRRVLAELGEERRARQLAAAIVRARARSPITTTRQLAALIERHSPRDDRRLHPATRVFQAIRIRINAELDALATALVQCVDTLAPRGRLCVISFHSLEDRLVKRFIAAQSRVDPVFAGLPRVPASALPKLKKIGRLIRPSEAEIAENPRARSARLRVAEKLGVAAS